MSLFAPSPRSGTALAATGERLLRFASPHPLIERVARKVLPTARRYPSSPCHVLAGQDTARYDGFAANVACVLDGVGRQQQRPNIKPTSSESTWRAFFGFQRKTVQLASASQPAVAPARISACDLRFLCPVAACVCSCFWIPPRQAGRAGLAPGVLAPLFFAFYPENARRFGPARS